MTTLTVHRDAVRLLVVDADGRVLLQHCITPDTHEEFWCTPGGAIHESETPSDAAKRELFEETGLRLDEDLGEPVWERMHEFTIGDGREFHQHERYHVVRVDAYEPVPRCLSDFERESIREQRWLRWEELRDVDATLLNPPELPELLRRVLASETAAATTDDSAALSQ